MRKIKFRGKTVFGDRWVYGGIIQSESGIYIIEPSASIIDSIVYKTNPETVGQFTGLYDKNGKGIYEGDILEYKDERNGKAYRRPVVFNQAAFCQEIDLGTPKPEYNPIRNHDLTVWSVVGNIHDNPELLKGGER